MAKSWLAAAGVGVLAFVGFAAVVCAAPAPPVLYVFIPQADRDVAVQWDEWTYVGSLDRDGNLHIRDKLDRVETAAEMSRKKSDRIPCTVYKYHGPLKCFEFRAGRLIRGTLMPAAVFVPEKGAKILSIEDYRYGTDDAIWNLPGCFMRKDLFEQRRAWLSAHAGRNPSLLEEKASLDAAAERKR